MDPSTVPARPPAWSWRQLSLALTYRGFSLFFTGKSVSFAAQGAHTVAITYLVWQLTDGGMLLTAAVVAFQFAPTVLFGPLLGNQVDRYDRRRAMIVQQCMGAAVAAALSTLALTGVAQLWHIYALMFCTGTLTAWSNPLQAAFLSEVLPKQDGRGRHPRKSGGSLNSLAWQSGRLLGAALAGILIPVWGVAAVLWLAPLAALAPIILISCIRAQDRIPASTPVGKRRGGVWEGVRYIGSDPDLMAGLLLGSAVGMVAMGAIQSGLQLLVLGEFGGAPDREAQVLGWVGMAVAAGGIVSQLLTGGGSYTPSGRILTRIATALAVALAGAALAPGLGLVLALAAVCSLLAYAHQTAAQLVNLHAPEALQGRIAGLWFALSSGGKAISGLLVGVLAELVGPRYGLLVCGALLIVAAQVVAVLYRRRTSPAAGHP